VILNCTEGGSFKANRGSKNEQITPLTIFQRLKEFNQLVHNLLDARNMWPNFRNKYLAVWPTMKWKESSLFEGIAFSRNRVLQFFEIIFVAIGFLSFLHLRQSSFGIQQIWTTVKVTMSWNTFSSSPMFSATDIRHLVCPFNLA